jgi:hypothetical protein
MRVLSRSQKGERPGAERPSPQGLFEERLTRSVAQILDELAPGRAAVRITRPASVPYAGVSLEVVPRNPRAASLEVVFDDVDVQVFVGSQGCRRHFLTEEALGPAALSFFQALLRSVVLGSYRETASRRGWWLCRVEGFADAVRQETALSASRLWIYGNPRSASFEPY